MEEETLVVDLVGVTKSFLDLSGEFCPGSIGSDID
jgi:hypothetical protein